MLQLCLCPLGGLITAAQIAGFSTGKNLVVQELQAMQLRKNEVVRMVWVGTEAKLYELSGFVPGPPWSDAGGPQATVREEALGG